MTRADIVYTSPFGSTQRPRQQCPREFSRSAALSHQSVTPKPVFVLAAHSADETFKAAFDGKQDELVKKINDHHLADDGRTTELLRN